MLTPLCAGNGTQRHADMCVRLAIGPSNRDAPGTQPWLLARARTHGSCPGRATAGLRLAHMAVVAAPAAGPQRSCIGEHNGVTGTCSCAQSLAHSPTFMCPTDRATVREPARGAPQLAQQPPRASPASAACVCAHNHHHHRAHTHRPPPPTHCSRRRGLCGQRQPSGSPRPGWGRAMVVATTTGTRCGLSQLSGGG